MFVLFHLSERLSGWMIGTLNNSNMAELWCDASSNVGHGISSTLFLKYYPQMALVSLQHLMFASPPFSIVCGRKYEIPMRNVLFWRGVYDIFHENLLIVLKSLEMTKRGRADVLVPEVCRLIIPNSPLISRPQPSVQWVTFAHPDSHQGPFSKHCLYN